ncbi:hypothetical protein QR680_013801 [Steinernema hermaphroditum]|uniref:Uncharacterized protein n=1 Tax=Steinernema hermaphroditum TaxID=289476 RepID=A0AA39I8C1_9BILA|nr:hypothetical protein QR680_013801 [Steinernema hermaphroditum]
MKFHVSKRISLLDEDLDVSAHGLPPGEYVRLVLTCFHVAGNFQSWARFKADSTGRVDLAKDAPVDGTYWGVDKMGLFSSMCPVTNSRPGVVMSFSYVEDLLLSYQLVAFNSKGDVLGQTTILKRILDPSVERIEITEGNVRGVMFRPKGNKKYRAVVDIHGLGGRCKEHRAALLAHKGFAVLALAIYDYKDLPKRLNDSDLNAVKEAIDWITSQAYTSDKCAVLGHSFGGYVSYLAALQHDKIASIITVNAPTFHASGISILENGKRHPYFTLTPAQEGHRRYAQNAVMNRPMWNHIFDNEPEAIEPYFIPLENVPANVSFMLIAGQQDISVPSVRWCQLLEKHLRKALNRRVDTVYLKNCGHLIEPPHIPQHNTVFNPHPPTYWLQGGDQYLQCVEQRELWPKIQEFIRTTVHVEELNAKL